MAVTLNEGEVAWQNRVVDMFMLKLPGRKV